MLEILGIIMLTNVNKKNAIARGRKPGGFAALTVILWVGLELLGLAIGAMAELGITTYFLALVMAAIGGLTSYIIAKNCKPGDYVPPAQAFMQSMATSVEPLAYPANITIVRESSMVGALVSWNLTLNGQRIGNLENGKTIMITTPVRQNILVATDSYGNELPPFTFDVEAGARAQVFFKTNRFLAEKSIGLRTPSAPRYAQPPAMAQLPAENTVTARPSFCQQCGTPLGEGEVFCSACGTRRFTPPSAGSNTSQPGPGTGPGYASMAMPVKRDATLVKAKPMRALWTVIWFTVVYVAIFFFQRFSGVVVRYSSSVAFLMVTAIFGVSIYLYMQKGAQPKILGICATFSGILLSFVHQLYPLVTPYPLEMRAYTITFYSIADILLSAITTAGGALLFSYIFRDKKQRQPAYGSAANETISGTLDKSKIWQVAFLTSLVSMVVNIVMFLIAVPLEVFKYQPNFLAQFLINNIFPALFIVFVPSAIHALVTMKTTRIKLSGWGYVWCGLCMLGMLASIVLIFLGPKTHHSVMLSSQLFMSVAALTGFIMLIAKRRLGWFVILFSAFTALMGQFQEAFRMTVTIGDVNSIRLLLTAIVGALTPVITWFSIKKAWNADDATSIPTPYPYPHQNPYQYPSRGM